jgi:hypothetical protein
MSFTQARQTLHQLVAVIDFQLCAASFEPQKWLRPEEQGRGLSVSSVRAGGQAEPPEKV